VFEVDPGVRVAPDQDGEEESGEGGRQQQDDQAQEAAVAQGHERRVVRPASAEKEINLFAIESKINCSESKNFEKLFRVKKLKKIVPSQKI
jgi:hypothetical protein